MSPHPPLSVIKALLLAASLGLSSITLALAGQVGSVSHLSGLLFAQKADGSAVALNVGSSVDEGDTLITQEGAFARIKLKDEAELVLRPNSQLEIRQYLYDLTRPQADSAVMRLLKGSLRTLSGWIGKRSQRDAYRMETPTATIGIRGTDYDARYCEDAASCAQGMARQDQDGSQNPPPPPPGLHVFTHSGSISVGNSQGEITVGPGQYGFSPSLAVQPIIMPPTQPPAQLFPSPPPSVGIPGTPPAASGGSLGPASSCTVR